MLKNAASSLIDFEGSLGDDMSVHAFLLPPEANKSCAQAFTIIHTYFLTPGTIVEDDMGALTLNPLSMIIEAQVLCLIGCVHLTP